MKIIISFAVLCFMHGAFAMKSHKRTKSIKSAQDFYRQQEARQDNLAIAQSKETSHIPNPRQHELKFLPKLNIIQE